MRFIFELAQDWWYRAKIRLKKYGWYLFLANFISKKLHLKSATKSIQIKINQIDTQHLK
jgi:hypothetical protein